MLKTRQEGGGRGQVTSLTSFLRPSNSCSVHFYLFMVKCFFCYSPQFPTDRLTALVGALISSTCQKISVGLKIKHNIS